MKKTKGIIVAVLSLLIVLSTTITSMACTGIYVGSDYSANGSTFYGRSEDLEKNHTKIFGVEEAKDYPEGYKFTDINGFSTDFAGHAYRYTYVKDSPLFEETMKDTEGNWIHQAYAAGGINEKGVSVSATVSTYYNDKAKAADPLNEKGLCEVSIPTLLLAKSSTAREAVNYLGQLLTANGAGENNSLFIADQNEVWYFDILSGHQYVAIKLPNDTALVQPNNTLLRSVNVNDTENVIASKDLVKLAEDNGFLVKDSAGNIDIARTYGQELKKSTKTRYWQGVNYLNPEQAKGFTIDSTLAASEDYNLFVKPDRKLSTYEILRTLAVRGEDSKYDSNKDGSIYPIGNQNQTECHFMEIRKGMPTELNTLQWVAMSDCEFSIYVPNYSALLTDVNSNYAEESLKYTPESIFWIFHQINTLGDAHRDIGLGDKVKEVFADYQKAIIDQQIAVDQDMVKIYNEEGKEAASKMATKIAKELSENTRVFAKEILRQMEEYLAAGDFSKPFEPDLTKVNTDPEYKVEKAANVDENVSEDGNKGSDPTTDNSKVKPDKKQTDKKASTTKPSPKTGDTSPIVTYVVIVVLAIAALIALLVMKRKKR